MIRECSTCKLWNGIKGKHKAAFCNHPTEIHKRSLGWLTPAKQHDDICPEWQAKNGADDRGDGIRN